VREEGKIVLRPVPQEETRGARFARSLRGKGTANMDMTTDELMELLRGE
jgi:hypothetical protein